MNNYLKLALGSLGAIGCFIVFIYGTIAALVVVVAWAILKMIGII